MHFRWMAGFLYAGLTSDLRFFSPLALVIFVGTDFIIKCWGEHADKHIWFVNTTNEFDVDPNYL